VTRIAFEAKETEGGNPPRAAVAAALLVRAIGWRLRGSVRLTHLVARLMRDLQAVPTAVDGATVFLDLRSVFCTDLLLGARPERAERALMQRLVKQGDVALDVGAYFGLHTVLLSRSVGSSGRVWAFEPSPAVLPCLSRTISQLGNTKLLPVALAAKRTSASFIVPSEASTASLADWTTEPESSKRRCEVPVDCLDRLVQEGMVASPDFMKCDVEGAEALVFQGAMSVLDREWAPLLLFEINPIASAAFGLALPIAFSLLRQLRNPKYEMFGLSARSELYPLSAPPDRLANVLAVPAARRARLEQAV
jgi:FkbM family methyltransferase